VACTIVMRWQRRFQSCFSESQILILKPGQAQSIFSASIFGSTNQHANLRQGERNPSFNVVHDDLANYNSIGPRMRQSYPCRLRN